MAGIHTKIAQLEAELRDKRAQARRQERRDHTRRKIIYGAAVLRFAEVAAPEQRGAILKRLHQLVTRPRDRTFLGLLPLPEQAPKRAPAQTERPAAKPIPTAGGTAPSQAAPRPAIADASVAPDRPALAAAPTPPEVRRAPHPRDDGELPFPT